MRTFKCAGVSRLKGKITFRATNRENSVYTEILKKDGHTDVNLVDLKSPMTKEDARKNLLGRKEFQTPEIQACLKQVDKEEKKEAKTAKAAKAAIVKPTQAKKPSPAAKKKRPSRAKKVAATEATTGDVANTERSTDDSVDVEEELGMPGFMKHVKTEEPS